MQQRLTLDGSWRLAEAVSWTSPYMAGLDDGGVDPGEHRDGRFARAACKRNVAVDW